YEQVLFFFSSRRRHTRWPRDWSSDVCSSDLIRQRLDRVVVQPIAPASRNLFKADFARRCGDPPPQRTRGVARLDGWKGGQLEIDYSGGGRGGNQENSSGAAPLVFQIYESRGQPDRSGPRQVPGGHLRTRHTARESLRQNRRDG